MRLHTNASSLSWHSPYATLEGCSLPRGDRATLVAKPPLTTGSRIWSSWATRRSSSTPAAGQIRQQQETGLFGPIPEMLVDKEHLSRMAGSTANCKGNCQPNVPRRGTTEMRSQQPCLPLNPPCRTQITRDDQVLGARLLCGAQCPPILTRPRARDPAAKGGFCSERPALQREWQRSGASAVTNETEA